MYFSNARQSIESTFDSKQNAMYQKITHLIIWGLMVILSTQSFAQTKPSIAVANPNVVQLRTSPTIAAKLIRLELIKLDNYVVYDEFDMEDVYTVDSNFRYNCLSKTCMVKLGKELNVDYVITGSFDELGNKIVISLKIIDVKNERIHLSKIHEFDNQEDELQRMTEILLKEMHGVEMPKLVTDRLEFQNEVVTTNNVGRIRNNGLRIGMGVMTGNLAEFATRPTDQGGLGIAPVVSMIGFQLEGQYVGTDRFSALVEGIVNISGIEQGQFIPSIAVLNGFRFGKGGWEFAFGPSFGLKRESYGFFDTDGVFGNAGDYISESEWNEFAAREYGDPNAYPEFYQDGIFTTPDPSEIHSGYDLKSKHLDNRGKYGISTSLVFAFGRTFKAGALNIPVNVFYSSRKNGGLIGLNVGFNIMKSKKNINKRRRRR